LAATGLGTALLLGGRTRLFAATALTGGDLAIGFAVLSNGFGDGRCTSELTLTNHGTAPLPARGWAICFNAQVIPKADPASGVALDHVNGDLVRLTPNEGFQPLAPGETRRIALTAEDPIIAVCDAPEGFFLVLDPGGPAAAAEPIGEPMIQPFTRPEQLSRGPKDKVPSQTPSLTFAQNAGLALLPEEAVGRITPLPAEAVFHPGTLQIGRKTRLRHPPALAGEAQLLQTALDGLTTSDAGAGTIELVLEPGLALPDGIAEQGYVLDIATAGIRLAGRTAQGVFHGIQSLLQLVPVAAWARPQPSLALPFCRIADAPLFAWRGQHFDIARNFSDKRMVLRLIDLLAFYKMNALHLHLTDDEGWRIEIPSLPELTSYGSQRGFSPGERAALQPALGSGPVCGVSPGSGALSQRDFVEILGYAKARHIRVIPEIDLPGHARAAIKAMAARHDRLLAAGKPAEEAEACLLHDPEDQSHYESIQGWHDNVLCIGRDSAYRFIELVVGDLAEAYRQAGLVLDLLHIGGDEVPDGVWENSPACRRFMAEAGLSTIPALQQHFFARLGRILAAQGIAMAGWEQAALVKSDGKEHPVPTDQRPGFTGFVWRNLAESEQPGIAEEMANAGYRTILCNADALYLDMAYEKAPDEPGTYWAGFTNLRKVFDFQPFGRATLTAAGRANLLGIQGALWGETLRNPMLVDYLLMPRLIAVAERGWSPAPAGEAREVAWTGFANRIGQRELPRLDRMGVLYRVPVPGLALVEGAVQASLDTPGLVLRCTTDGSDPDAASPAYAGPVPLAKGQVLKAAAFTATGRRGRIAALTA
jgi:hexosaminidase